MKMAEERGRERETFKKKKNGRKKRKWDRRGYDRRESERMCGVDQNSRERAVEAAKERECDRRKGKSGTREEAKSVKKEKITRDSSCFTFFPSEKCRHKRFLKEWP